MGALDGVLVRRGALRELARILGEASLPGRVFLIADAEVMAVHGETAARSLASGGIGVESTTFPSGEASKSLERAAELYSWLADRHAERRDTVVALGGGVTGDLVGFVAATYLRGVPLVQIPTTLLSQIDSSIGGKTAVDLPAGKNLVGVFYPARLSIIDPEALRTLPRAQLVADYAEVIKTGVIFDAELFAELEQGAHRLEDLDFLTSVIATCIELKGKVVDDDPYERGARATLNYGHTIAHAIEHACGYGRYRHGEAVAIGMTGAARLAVATDRLDPAAAARQGDLLARVGLPLTFEGAEPDRVLDAMRRDKKVAGGRIKWVLPDRIGAASYGIDVDPELVRDTVHGLRRA